MTATLGYMFVGLFGMVLLNVPIAVALAVVAVAAIWITQGAAMLPNVPLVMFDGATNFPLLAIPLFIFAGGIMNSSSISRRLVNLASAMLGFIRGGLAMVTVGASMFFAEISGSAVAGVAALGTLLIPAMKSRGYSKEVAAAISSSSASLAIILPPSIPMILYAVMAQVSVVKMFISGLLPGLLGGAGLAITSYFYARKYNFPVEQRFSLSKLGTAFREAAWALMLPVIILGGIFGGFVTATEGAAVAVVAALFISTVIYREQTLRDLYKSLVDAALQTAVVMLLVASSALIGVFLTEARVPQALAGSILEYTTNPYMVLLLLNIFFLILGMFLHSAAAIILTVPIVLPLIQQVGIDPVHFGLVLTLNLAIGQQTPPVASVLIAACAIAKSDIWKTTKANLGYIAVLLLVLMICTYVPWLALAPTRWFYGDAAG
ncbi:TRAP transporter large permease [Xanthobacter tagetidis]|uniref:TRAP transporter large permease protein n=1 Tax=Xanthobacter tagetidis TaxID=60216 RepID=A0A3L7AP35_9HYPH|nr:TRAP transporter large permease [Xanthobacter tagetidis]MBB6308289.1 tripartite ATP-independent transporter DctM subunit [Xanthobacter tagetidis]RLP81894.1 TRAP transporter large permease [Xanthobacter tagetidis]